MDPLLDKLRAWRPFTALVVGDLMLDLQVYGDAERLSPDAPVPILHVRRREENPGGAANVCHDLIALGGRVHVFGVVGDDETGRRLRTAMSNAGVEVSGLLVDQTRPTTLKQNLIGLAQARHPQKMFRLDEESRAPLDASVARRLLDAFLAALPKADVVCVEDYGKGVCAPHVLAAVLEAARQHGKPVFVDPARISDYGKYKGATVMTPNRTEAELATGLNTAAAAKGAEAMTHNTQLARRLLEAHELEAVVLTLDRHGALLLERGGEALAVPTVAREVYDVTGAGDMFLAGLAAARANGFSWAEAVRVANTAAGLEVEVFGVQPIPFERIHAAIIEQSTKDAGKLRTLDQTLAQVRARRRASSGSPASGQRIVFTNGCFDILHAGHISLLEQAAAQGDFLVVGLNTDASVRALKGPGRPVNSQEDRARVLGALGCVGAVVLFDEPTPMTLIEQIRPDVLVKGADYTKDKVVGGSLVESYGGKIVLVDLVKDKSTTGTIKRLQEQAS